MFFLFGISEFSFSQTIPTYTIAQVRGANSFEGGGADSNNVKCKIVGVVYGENIGTTGNRVQFVLRDATGGIGLFKNVNDLGITLHQGDSIRAIGIVNSFNGLSQITVDSVKRLGTNRPIKTPTIVEELNENTESDLVKFENYTIVPGTWPNPASGSGFTAKLIKDNLSVDLRIDNDCNLFGTPAPTGYINVVGLGGQFDNLPPRNTGYQLLPRNALDITLGIAPPNPTIRFVSPTGLVSESSGIVQIPVSSSGISLSDLVVRIVPLDSNASFGVDYALPSPPEITFPASVFSNQAINLTIINDLLEEGTEKFKLVLRRPTGTTTYTIGADSVVTITILDDEISTVVLPTYPIGLLRGDNNIEGGVADSLNVNCKINGTLYGPNLRGVNNGIQFTIRDATGGINIFNSTINFGLTSLAEGDSVRAIGKVAHFNGLSQLNLDSIVVLATGRPLKPATPVDSLSEATESDLVVVSNYQIVDPTQWTTGIGTGFTVQVNNGTRTLDLRIDNDCALFQMPAPSENILSITGLGGQFDSSIPRNSGYQLIPRKASDLALGVGVATLDKKMKVTIFPNPSSGWVQFKIGEGSKEELVGFELFNSMGARLIKTTGSLEEINKKASDVLGTSPSGFYQVRFQVAEHTFVQKLIRH